MVLPRQRRRRTLISAVQYRIVAFNLAYLSFFALALLLLAWRPLVDGLQDSSPLGQERHRSAIVLLFLHSHVLPMTLAFASVFTIHTVVFSHRILGPLVAFRRAFELLGRGKFDVPFRIRKRDHLHAEAEAFDAMRQELGARLAGAERAHRQLADEWAHLAEQLHAGTSPSSAEFDRLSRRIERASSVWLSFALEPTRETPPNESCLDSVPPALPDPTDRPEVVSGTQEADGAKRA